MRKGRGIRQITRGLGSLDREVFEAVANSPSPLFDVVMPRVTHLADHSKLWFAIAAALAATGKPSAERGAARGIVSLAMASLVTNQAAKRLRRRDRPMYESVPLARRAHRLPTSNSLPSGHSASAAAFALGVGLENPPVGLALAGLASLVGISRVATGAHYPGDVLAGFGIGASVAVLGARLIPPIVPPRVPAAELLALHAPQRPSGSGVVIVVNPASGSGTGTRVIEQIRKELPDAEVVELAEHDDVEKVLREAAQRAEVLGVGGGDGTVAMAAAIAVQADLPLAVFPAGTFNHFAKDIGCAKVAEVVGAIRSGSVVRVDVARLNSEENGETVLLNTASIGAYPQFVRTREKLEHKISKPLAGAWSMFHTLRTSEPVRIRFDNRELETSLFFLGNGTYLPSGFAPSTRLRMDDGLLDVRLLESGPRFSTLRIVVSLALGRLERSPLYHQLQVPEFSFTAVDGPTVVAHDGEIGAKYTDAQFTAHYRALKVFQPDR